MTFCGFCGVFCLELFFVVVVCVWFLCGIFVVFCVCLCVWFLCGFVGLVYNFLYEHFRITQRVESQI